ncbi:hypothetical protein ACFQ6B_20030 [Streptomyces wedmorensis]|uniref:Secreted protein n=1 Tax=Streptomyces wedmorensis TaxID=43759 RepID=A0ABW6IWT3_STRWE
MTMERSSRPRRRSRTISAVVSALGLLGLMTTAAQPAAAATPFAAVDASKLKLTAGDFGGRAAAISALETSGRVTSFTTQPALAPVLDGTGAVGVAGRSGLCHTSNLDPAYSPKGFCWNAADDTSSEWTPQGITGSHDAQPGGTWSGRSVQIASWHNANNTQARVTVVDTTDPAAAPVYHRVLLVDPYGSGDTANFEAVGSPTSHSTPKTGAHADGVAWYGNKLFVATGHQIQVYDLRHLWRTDSGSTDVGVVDGKAYAAQHEWALPMIGIYSNAALGAPCSDTAPTTPCMTSLSLDRTGTDGLIVSEIGAQGGRPLVRWPLNATTALLQTDTADDTTGTVAAAAAYRVPVWKVQGAATDGTYYYFSGECPETAGTTNSDVPYCVHRAKPGEAPHVLTKAPPLTQNLSWSPSAGRLWGLNERANYAPGALGKRVVFSLDPPA